MKIKDKYDNNFFIYVNGNGENFAQKLNPPANKMSVEKHNLISLADENLFGVMHTLITEKNNFKSLSLKDTLEILTNMDKAIQIRAGKDERYITPKKWNEIKTDIDESKITGEIKIDQLKSSFTPVQTNIKY